MRNIQTVVVYKYILVDDAALQDSVLNNTCNTTYYLGRDMI